MATGPLPDPGQGIRLAQKFPRLGAAKAPSLFTFNGIGTTMVGRRNADQETGTYLKTQCFTIFFLPILRLRAFRVKDAPKGGWYFFGREPLSAREKAWNTMVLAAILAAAAWLFFWSAHRNSPVGPAPRRPEEAAATPERAESKAPAGELKKEKKAVAIDSGEAREV